MIHCERRWCSLEIFFNVFLMFNGTLTIDASRQIINKMNVTSTNPEKVKVLNFGFSQSGAMNMSFQALQPWDSIKVRFCNLQTIF